MEAGFQHRSRAMSSPHCYDYLYTPCARPKTSDSTTLPFSITRLRLPPRTDGACRGYEPTAPTPPHWKRTSQGPSWSREDAKFHSKPAHKQSIENWVDEQVHLTDRSNYERRAQPMGKEELRQRMWDELVYEYEAEAHKWMNHEAEMRRRAQEREREEARRRIVQEDIMRIQARVRERRDSERRVIAEERRRSVERAKEQVRRDQGRAERAMLEAWHAYESRWAAISASSEPLGFRDIPWPLLAAPVQVADMTPENIGSFLLHPVHSSHHSRRERIRTALLRWHPDRFRRILNRVVDSDRSMVEECVGVIARYLNELLAKEGKAPQQGR
ncbi:hypothetical protein L210DRAFT_890464 [Boletus edulis BED1]|uniref:Uncharacterized protein n=1 Tax=Boletus edulis BED1 TaxID=1328754 RepID=A0AAD4BX23_BOLED|nr:hypothetical protein L210DRAFT_890464 [Boletus edulis BED1]